MNTPRLDGIRNLLLKELDTVEHKDEKDTESKLVNKSDVINKGINTYIEELSDEIIELKKEKYKVELEKIQQDEELRQHMERTKSIVYEGFVMAFVVGLAVNQCTDLISLYKGTIPYDVNILKSSIKFVGVLVLISAFTYFYKFFVDVIRYLEKYIKKEKK